MHVSFFVLNLVIEIVVKRIRQLPKAPSCNVGATTLNVHRHSARERILMKT